MPPRHAYWTILIDNAPTAFRAREREDLLPTLNQLRRTNKDVLLKWFGRGKLWDTPEAAQTAGREPTGPARSADATGAPAAHTKIRAIVSRRAGSGGTTRRRPRRRQGKNATNLAALRPPARNPGATNLAALRPPARNPGATNLAARRPPARNPGATNPAALRPPARNPGATNPAARRPPARNPGATNLAALRPPARNPGATNPAALRPPARNPGATNRAALRPPVRNPGATNLAARRPPVRNPGATNPQRSGRNSPRATRRTAGGAAARPANRRRGSRDCRAGSARPETADVEPRTGEALTPRDRRKPKNR